MRAASPRALQTTATVSTPWTTPTRTHRSPTTESARRCEYPVSRSFLGFLRARALLPLGLFCFSCRYACSFILFRLTTLVPLRNVPTRSYAPGVGVTSAWIGDPDSDNTISGTSMAAPHVCGIMAKARSISSLFLGSREGGYRAGVVNRRGGLPRHIDSCYIRVGRTKTHFR